ncbi:tyrosine-type recombinase/integrase [Roseomonas marmotae]|uniref:tyrosine-type recombinase/integrase n=1 Tax=Roseomonas marmotae TaxID=2768161 RepID=UPI001AD7230C|nr:tyrosine-type recombinase/integrase [Roseomonas marmotae]QTI78329.1 tyrosine-type recombinase/integrase [Roseomonas marmotae]
MSYRELISQAQQEDEENNRNAISERDRSDRASVLESLAEQEAEQLPHGKGEEFLAVVHGGGLPLGHFVEQWLGQGTYTARTEAEHRLALTKLQDWLASINQAVLVQAVTRRVAGEFVASLQEMGSLARKTINKHVSSLSSYWRWMVSRGHAEANPWSGQGLSTMPEHRRGQHEQKERPFTDDELKTLLSGPVRRDVADMMLLAALTGARREELAQLKVGDLREGAFFIRGSKTAAGVRAIPIHPALQELVTRRTAGKMPNEFLLDELKESGDDGARSNGVGKAFEYYRRRVKVDESRPGKRRSLVNFHSFRRWFITRAERAGQPPHIIAAVVGHARQGMTLGTYSAGPSGEQYRVCVEAVKLPAGLTLPPPEA